MNKTLAGFAFASVALLALALLPAHASAASPPTATYFVCPSVSLNNAHGMWVVGTHGAYYVLVPTQGSTGSKVYLTVPVAVTSLAQIPAGWAVYNSLPSYPNFEGTAVVLSEGISTWLGNAPGFSEGDMVSVTGNGNGGYTVTVVASMASPGDIGSVTVIGHAIPLASAAFW